MRYPVQRMTRLVTIFAILSVGCSSAYDPFGVGADDAPDVGEKVPDAGSDAGTTDGGDPPDAGEEPDAGDAPDAGEAPDAGDPPDAGEEPDAGETCVPSECGPRDCCGDRCCVLVPLNANAIGDLLGTASVVVSSPVTVFDTTTCSAGALGACVVSGGLCVCHAESFSIEDGATLRVTGTMPLVLVARKRIDVSGTLDLSALAQVGGAGARTGPNALAERVMGGAGASHGGRGGNGGADRDGVSSPAQAATGEAFEPLLGGRAGQSSVHGIAGAGGGGVQLVAGERLEILGQVLAQGAGGGAPENRTGNEPAGGAGGGSGGTILLQAPQVLVRGGVFANGGGGGGADGSGGALDPRKGISGQSGRASTQPATGGSGGDGFNCLGSVLVGGDGGAGGSALAPAGPGITSASAPCAVTTHAVGGGGGGGSAGLIRIDAVEENFSGASMSPEPQHGQLILQ